MKEVGFKSRNNLAWCLRANALRRRFGRFERLNEAAMEERARRRLRKDAEGVLLYLGLLPREELVGKWGWRPEEGWEVHSHTGALVLAAQEATTIAAGGGAAM